MSFLRKLLFGANGPKAVAGGPRPVADADYETTASGLQFCDLQVGTGPSPHKGQKVTVHYTGWLVSGKRFDSSRAKDRPFTFEIGRRKVIRGWDEGVLSMKVGGVRQLRIPPTLGYGAAGSPPAIPRNATLLFEVELLEVEG